MPDPAASVAQLFEGFEDEPHWEVSVGGDALDHPIAFVHGGAGGDALDSVRGVAGAFVALIEDRAAKLPRRRQELFNVVQEIGAGSPSRRHDLAAQDQPPRNRAQDDAISGAQVAIRRQGSAQSANPREDRPQQHPAPPPSALDLAR